MSSKKSVLIVSAVFPPEQVTSAFLNYDLALALAKEYDVTVLRPYPTRPLGMEFDYKRMEEDSFKTILIDSYTCPKSCLFGRMRESVSFGNKCVKYIKGHINEIDFIVNGGWQLFCVYMIAKAAVRYKIPYLITVQDIYPESLFTGHRYPMVFQWLVKTVLLPIDRYYTSHAVKVRTISEQMVAFMSETRHLPREHYVVVNNWQNDEDFENLPKNVQNRNRFVFVYVGSINVHANVDLIIRAFHEAHLDNAILQIFGGGNHKEYCKALVEKLGNNSVFWGQVARKEVPVIQANADVAIMALPEGNGGICVPSKMMSYMLSGKPILASVEKGCTAEKYILDAQCGISVEPDNIDALIEGFRTFYFMGKEQLSQMSENSRKFAKENFTRKANLPKVISIIENTLMN